MPAHHKVYLYTPLAKLMGIDFKHSSFARPTFGLNPDKFTEVREIPFNLHALQTNSKFTKPETNTAMQRLTPKSPEERQKKLENL